MEIIFDTRVLKHVPNCPVEGIYRLNGFNPNRVILDGTEIEHIIKLHGLDYLKKVEQLCNERVVREDLETSSGTYESCIVSVRVALDSAKKNSFGITRPAGHHAFRYGEPRGMCFFNNMAIATNHLLSKGEKIFIFDFDVHHGDGTQDIYKNKRNVFFFSIHQEGLWPYSGTLEEHGKNYANLPIPKNGGNEMLPEIMDLVERLIQRFNPTKIGISAGFDGHYLDPLSQLRLTEECYGYIGHRIGKLRKNVFALLEGGYHQKVNECVTSFIKGLEGRGKKQNTKEEKSTRIVKDRIKRLEDLFF